MSIGTTGDPVDLYAFHEFDALYGTETGFGYRTRVEDVPLIDLVASFDRVWTSPPHVKTSWAYFFLDDPVELTRNFLLPFGSGWNGTCPTANPPIAGIIPWDVRPAPAYLFAGDPPPIERTFSLADWSNPGAPASDDGGHVKTVMISNPGPCSRGVATYDIQAMFNGALWEAFLKEFGKQVDCWNPPCINRMDRYYAYTVPFLDRWSDADPQSVRHGFFLDAAINLDIEDPYTETYACFGTEFALKLTNPVNEVDGGILTIAPWVSTLYVEEDGPEAEAIQTALYDGLMQGTWPAFKAAVLTGPARQTVDVLGAACDVGNEDDCGAAVDFFAGGVAIAVRDVFRDLGTWGPYLPEWYDVPTTWDDKAWEFYADRLATEIRRELEEGWIDQPAFWDSYNQCTTHGFSREERRQRTKFRNWRCVHDPNRLDRDGNPDPDPPGRGRCEVVLRAKRLSYKPGGFHLVWFDDPFDPEDFEHPAAAISVAVWVAAHQVTEEPDDLVAAANELCAVPKPLHASFKYRLDHSFTQFAQFNVSVTPHEACE